MGKTGVNGAGERILIERERLGLSQRALARKSEISFGFISRIESGERLPSLETLRVLGAALGVSPHYLETGDRRGDYVYRKKGRNVQ